MSYKEKVLARDPTKFSRSSSKISAMRALSKDHAATGRTGSRSTTQNYATALPWVFVVATMLGGDDAYGA